MNINTVFCFCHYLHLGAPTAPAPPRCSAGSRAGAGWCAGRQSVLCDPTSDWHCATQLDWTDCDSSQTAETWGKRRKGRDNQEGLRIHFTFILSTRNQTCKRNLLDIPPCYSMCLTQSGHLCRRPLWSSGGHSTDPEPAGSLVVGPVTQLDQWECHLHPEAWGWEKPVVVTCWNRVYMCVCIYVFIQSCWSAGNQLCLYDGLLWALWPQNLQTEPTERHRVHSQHQGAKELRVWATAWTSSCSSRGMRKAKDWSQKWAVPSRRGSTGSQKGSFSLGSSVTGHLSTVYNRKKTVTASLWKS